MEHVLKRFVLILAGVLLAYIAAATAATGSFQPECFYDSGETEEIYLFTLQQEQPGLVYQHADDEFFTVTEDLASFYLPVAEKKWKYVVLDTSLMNAKMLELEFSACDENWNIQETQKIRAGGGKEIFSCELPKCKKLILSIRNQKGVQFCFHKLQFRKKMFSADKKKMVFAGFAALFLYAGCCIFCIVLKKKKDIDVLLPLKKAEEKCLFCYLRLVGKAAELLYGIAGPITGKMNARVLSAVRIVPLSAWILAEMLMRGYGMRLKVIPFHYLAVIGVLFVFAVTSLERPPGECPWNHTLVRAWFWFSVIMMLSGIFVPKRWPGIGVLFLTVFAVWFWIWGNMKNPDRILADISIALKIVFWIATGLSVFGRTYIPGIPYGGVYINQNVFVAFLIMILAVELGQVGNLFLEQEKKPCLFVYLSAELCLILFFLFSTKSRGGLLTGMVVMFFCFLNRMRKDKKKALWFALLTMLLFLPVSYAAERTILYVQSVFPERIEYADAEMEWDAIFADSIEFGEIVNAAEGEGNISSAVKATSLDALTSGRVTLWKTYIRKFNLWGHFYRERTNGVRIHSHNAFTFIVYLYGIFALIPYCVMWWMIFARGVSYAKGRRRYDLLPLAMSLGFFLQAMTDTLEEPFSMESWMMVYIVIGVLFGRVSEKGRSNNL